MKIAWIVNEANGIAGRANAAGTSGENAAREKERAATRKAGIVTFNCPACEERINLDSPIERSENTICPHCETVIRPDGIVVDVLSPGAPSPSKPSAGGAGEQRRPKTPAELAKITLNPELWNEGDFYKFIETELTEVTTGILDRLAKNPKNTPDYFNRAQVNLKSYVADIVKRWRSYLTGLVSEAQVHSLGSIYGALLERSASLVRRVLTVATTNDNKTPADVGRFIDNFVAMNSNSGTDSGAVACPFCQQEVRIQTKNLGAKLRCKGCDQIFTAGSHPLHYWPPPSNTAAQKVDPLTWLRKLPRGALARLKGETYEEVGLEGIPLPLLPRVVEYIKWNGQYSDLNDKAELKLLVNNVYRVLNTAAKPKPVQKVQAPTPTTPKPTKPAAKQGFWSRLSSMVGDGDDD